jgi:uncharacterized OB-fold protein
LQEACPYVVVLVELELSGVVRMVGNWASGFDIDPEIGSAVEAVFEDHEGDSPFTLVHWGGVQLEK